MNFLVHFNVSDIKMRFCSGGDVRPVKDLDKKKDKRDTYNTPAVCQPVYFCSNSAICHKDLEEVITSFYQKRAL